MNVIDINKLNHVKVVPGGYVAQCPACAEQGEDLTGKNHLSIVDDVKFNCVKYPKDKDHNRRVLELVGTESDEDNISIEQIIRQPKILKDPIWPAEVLNKLIKDYSYWEKRGIPATVVEPFGGGIALEGKMRGRFVFPCFNENGKIVMFSGRKIFDSDIMKWKHVGSKNNIYLFPPFAEPDIIKSGKIIILESIGDLLNLRKYEIYNGVVVFGLNLSSKMMKFLIQSNLKKIIISTNNDIAKNSVGNNAARTIKRTLINYFDESIIEIILPKSKDWGEATEAEILEFKARLEAL